MSGSRPVPGSSALGVLVGLLLAGALGGCGLPGLARVPGTGSAPSGPAPAGAGSSGAGASGAGSSGAGASGAAPAGGNGSGAGSLPAGPELPTPAGPLEHAPGAPSPAVAVTRFATAYVNWDAADVAAHLRRLATDCVGQARTALELQARQTGADPELGRLGIANHGEVMAAAPLAGGPAGRWVVVTRESSSATHSSAYAGLGPQWHVALAGVVRRRDGWVISVWQPES